MMERLGITWVSASLRVVSSSATPDQITELMQVKPTNAFRKGERSSPVNPRSAVRAWNTWLLDTPLDSSAAVEDHIEWLLDFVDAHREELRSLPLDAKVDLAVGLAVAGQGSMYLPSPMLTRIAGSGTGIVIDLYSED
jgi:hypothetical protein